MKRLRDIKVMIELAQQGWSEIENEITNEPLSIRKRGISLKMEKLKNLLEDIRGNIETLLYYSRCRILAKVCKKFLDTIFSISEGLRVSYVFPGYVESFYIMDTIKFVDGLTNCKD